MTLYEQRLSDDKDALRAAVLDLAGQVRTGLGNAVTALETNDSPLAYQTILRDGPINRGTEALESECHRFIAKHLPSAGHLRFVSAVMRIAVLLERMGDYAVTISRQMVVLKEPLEGAFLREVTSMAADAFQMFDQAMAAFSEADASLARGTMGFAKQVDRDYVNALALLQEKNPSDVSVHDLFGRLVIIRQLERVSDQAKNLCEETVFALTGETKQRKPVPVLVVDEKDDSATHIVAALAARLYDGKVTVETAGVDPAAAVRPETLEFLESRGYPVAGLEPSSLNEARPRLAGFKVIVSLGPAISSVVEAPGYETVALDWPDEVPGDSLEAAYRNLGLKLGDLVALLRG